MAEMYLAKKDVRSKYGGHGILATCSSSRSRHDLLRAWAIVTFPIRFCSFICIFLVILLLLLVLFLMGCFCFLPSFCPL